MATKTFNYTKRFVYKLFIKNELVPENTEVSFNTLYRLSYNVQYTSMCQFCQGEKQVRVIQVANV